MHNADFAGRTVRIGQCVSRGGRRGGVSGARCDVRRRIQIRGFTKLSCPPRVTGTGPQWEFSGDAQKPEGEQEAKAKPKQAPTTWTGGVKLTTIYEEPVMESEK